MPNPDAEARVVTAASTDCGKPVYLSQTNHWTDAFAEAQTFAVGDALDQALEHARGDQRRVCDPYAIVVKRTAAGFEPTTTKERIRATGPTTPLRRSDA